MITAIRLPSLYSLLLGAENWSMTLSRKKLRRVLLSQHCIVYKFACDLCDVVYAGYIARHFHPCIAEHKYSAICKHFSEAQLVTKIFLMRVNFELLKSDTENLTTFFTKCHSSKNFRPSLNTQSDSNSVKLFV